MTSYLLLGQLLLGIGLLRIRDKVTSIDNVLLWTGYVLVFTLLLGALLTSLNGEAVIRTVGVGPLFPP